MPPGLVYPGLDARRGHASTEVSFPRRAERVGFGREPGLVREPAAREPGRHEERQRARQTAGGADTAARGAPGALRSARSLCAVSAPPALVRLTTLSISALVP